MKDKNEIVAVKCEGSFTEWYSPYFREPYEDNEEYREYYNSEIINVQPVIGPSLGTDDEENISGDLDCLSDRMMCGVRSMKDWEPAKKAFEDAVAKALETGEKQVLDYRYTDPDIGEVVVTPYRRGDMPKPNEEHLKVYGPYADLMRERVAEI